MRIQCHFQAVIHQADDERIVFDLYHEYVSDTLQPVQKQRDLLRTGVSLPRQYFDFLVHNGALQVQGAGAEPYKPRQVKRVAIGMNIKSLGATVLFDMCFSPQTYKLWQNTDAMIEEIALSADLFEEYVYRLGALSRFRYLGRVEDPLVATELGENDMIEFKRDFLNSKHAIIKAVIAFANSNNGNLFLGIDDDGKIIGINEELKMYESAQQAKAAPDEISSSAIDRYLLAITQYIQAKTTPMLSPFPKITLKKIQDKYVVAIFTEVNSDLICGLDKNGDKYVAIRTNNQSVIVRDPHQIGEVYVKRRLGSEVSRRLGLL
ncbi:AlbA family DNA-binding domain-containing protein [Brevibacillus dissolubilis]|uniref:AlbA family DNA-binding domain-containing protein n=1 Tax=Brevibacillus dissolubilis TaxID=1844116 RepID=UPI0011160F40|nr:ATP-binding protein [Brevibacillus dissolubilis]